MAIAIALGLLLLILLAAPWLLLLVAAPLWVPLGIDALVVACVLALALGRAAMQALRARKLEPRALPAKGGAPVARPDVAPELDEIRRSLDAAIGTIARSRLAGGGRAAVQALPWYVLLGPAGSGKTALVRASGLSFPTTSREAASAGGTGRGPGATKRADLWLGNDAVLIDTAGRWATSDDDAEWRAFAERLHKHRGDRALDGALLTIPMEVLLEGSEAERASLARQLRERLEHLSHRFGVALPVYAVVTRADRLVGFSETFASLDKRERARPWGFVIEPSGAATEDAVHEGLGELERTLRRRVVGALASERRLEARGPIAELPAHFASIVDPLSTLLAQVFVTSVYGETPALRGVYLTSATQEGRPSDRLLASSLRAAAIDARAAAEPGLEPRSYFVHQVFTRVALADAETAAPSTKARRRRALVQLAVGTSLASISALLVIATALSWRANRLAVDALADALPVLEPTSLPAPRALAPLRAQLSSLRDERREGAPWSMRLGLYGGVTREDRARRAYAQALTSHVLAPILAADAEELRRWGAAFESDLSRRPSADEAARATLLLERQLRFAAPRETSEPRLDDAAGERLAHAIAARWCEAIEAPASACEPDATLLVAIARETDLPRPQRDEEAVRLARLALARVDPTEQALAALAASVSGRGYDLTLASLVGTTGHALTSERVVRGVFTRRAWESVVRERLASHEGARERAWLLGAHGGESDASARSALREAYLRAYADEWRSFLGSVRIRATSDPTETIALLEDLGRGTPPPLGRLLAAVDDNATLRDAGGDTPESTLLDRLTTELTTRTDAAATGAGPGPSDPARQTIVARALDPYTSFAVRAPGSPPDAPLGIDVYRDELGLLRDALASYQDDPSSAAALETRLVAARRRVDGLVADRSPGTRDFFELVLRPPVEAAAVTSSRAMAGAVADAYCAAVRAPFASSFTGRYPFAPEGDDAALDEVSAFYRPGGTLWTHYDAALASIAPRAGARFELAARLERGSPYASSLPAFLARSQAITSGLFPPGSSEPRIELDVRIHPTPGAASVRLSVGGATIDYRNGPETWSRVVWPGESPSAGARLEVESARDLSERITEEGPWGLFRLVEAASIEARSGERVRTLRWHLPGHDVDVIVDVRPVRTECVLFDERPGRALGAFRGTGVVAPRRITRAGSECAP
ncbi:MAG: type VI secretion system membrane subunit TssM [Sandaracinus sp.]